MRPALLAPLVAAAVVAGTPGTPRRLTAPVRGVADSVVVSTAWLAAHMQDPDVVVLEVDLDDSASARGHIPGARLLPFASVAARSGTLDAELPSVADLRATFERLGVSDATRVVLSYAREAPSAARGFVALDYLGHDRVSLLDGGLARWQAEGRPVTTVWPRVAPGVLHPRPRAALVATAPWIAARLDRPGVAVIDTRSDGEYLGTAGRHGMPSAGHLAGARQLQWQQLFRDDAGSAAAATLRSPAELRQLFADRMRPGDTVVTYCWVGYRASTTYFAARALGLPVKLYDGSYQDWSQRQLPVRAGPTPWRSGHGACATRGPCTPPSSRRCSPAGVVSSTPSPNPPHPMKTLVALLALAAGPAAAQSAGRAARPADPGSSVVASVRELWQKSRGDVLAAAEQVPEADYAFRPTPEVRNMGQLFAHVASSQRMLCSTALGEKNGGDTVGTTKAEVVHALRASNDYCARAYAMSDADAMRPATPSDATARSILGTSHTRFHVLALNAWHDSEHYGNVVTYMRLRNLVPPSSQPPNVRAAVAAPPRLSIAR